MATRRTEEELDPWGLDSGLPDDFDITIKKSRFGYLENYQNGEAPLLIWDYESPDVESEYPIIWPLGTKWAVSRDGRVATHPKRKRFIDTSMVGRLIQRCADMGVLEQLRSRGSPLTATIWEGLSFHMKRETVVLPPGAAERGLPEQVIHLMPVEFLGTGQKAVPRAAKAAAEEAPSELITRLTELARTLTLNRFQKAAMNIDAVNETANRALLSEILDDGETGFWAKAQTT